MFARQLLSRNNTYGALRTSVKARCFRCSNFFLSSYACEATQSVCQTLARIEHISSLQVVHSFEFTSYDFIMRYRNFHNKCTAFFCNVATFIGMACLHAHASTDSIRFHKSARRTDIWQTHDLHWIFILQH